MTPAEFFKALYRHFEGGLLTVFSIDSEGRRRTDWYSLDEIDDLVSDTANLADRDVWFGVATRRERLSAGRRGEASDCVEVPGLWADIDIAGPNHRNNEGLPATLDEAIALVGAFPLPPSILVWTGGGLHGYWMFTEPVAAADATVLLERWATTWERVAGERGLRTDNVHDIARVLRVPGTVNNKTPDPVAVEIHSTTGAVYDVSDIQDATDDPPEKAHRSADRGPVLSLRPGDEYNQRHTCGDVLKDASWTLNKTQRNGDEMWLHPWQPTSDCSATVYADGHCAIWSDTAVAKTALEKRHSYDPFGLYVAIMHNGDYAAATRRLAAEGYGSNVEYVNEFADVGVGGGHRKRHVPTNNRSLDDLTNDVVAELVALNDPPVLFRHGEVVTQLDGTALDPIDRVRLTHVVETSMSPVSISAKGEVKPTRIDAQTLDLALYRLNKTLPPIEGVMRAPFLRADGTVCASEGYDASSRLYLAETLDVAVPDEPTSDEVAAAVALIDEMIVDFPLESAADRAHVHALLLTMVTRHLVPLVPLFAFDGNGPGVGKNLLSECCIFVATGEWAQTDPLPLDAEEQRKQITALLGAGRTVALFDEAHTLGGTSLARLITSTTWGDRLLGYSKQVSYPNRLTVCALGNNIEVQGDMPRRTILVRLASPLSRPELRQDFRHGDLRGWVTEHRPALLGALLTMLRSWSAAGAPQSTKRLGSFDAWAQMIGGVLEHAGVDGFLANADEMRERAATDDVDMAAHLAELEHHFGEFEFTSGDAARLLLDGAIETWPPKVNDEGRKLPRQLGYAYRKASARWYGDRRIERTGETRTHAASWMIRNRTASPLQNAGDAGDAGNATPYAGNVSSLVVETGSGERNGFPASPASPAVSSPPRRRITAKDIGL